MRRTLLFIAMMPILLTIAASFAQAVPSSKIAFMSTRDGNSEIYTMDARDGTKVTNLTKDPSQDAYPAYSADGTKIAFVSNRAGTYGIYVMNAYDGTDVTRLTQGHYDSSPAFSPDGSEIVFTREVSGSAPNIYAIGVDGKGLKRLTNRLASDYWPSFSPDGRTIVFCSNVSGNEEIYTMDSEGSNQTPLTNNPARDCEPNYSRDGRSIVFTSNRDGNDEIYKLSLTRGSVSRLTNDAAGDRKPAFSSDGASVVFFTDRDLNNEIYAISSDGSNPRRLTINAASDFYPAWAAPAPSQPKIVFMSLRDGDYEIYSMDADGSNIRQLTHNTEYDVGPKWSPDGTMITFARGWDNDSRVCVMKADGTNENCFPSQSGASQPSWSPDGRRILYFSANKLRTMDAVTGVELSELYTTPWPQGYSTIPSAYSPDGNKIAFVDGEIACDDIYVMDASGANIIRLGMDCRNQGPSWSPDGTKIAFTHWFQIAVMNADGTNWTRLTYSPTYDGAPQWTSDGRILFCREFVSGPTIARVYNWEIFIMNSDGSNQIQLTSHPQHDLLPNWRP